MATVAAIWRHPIKSHGRENLASVELIAGQTMPWDRHWAVIHDRSKFDATAPAWAVCRNFMIGTLTPRLSGLWAKLDEATATITLTHPDLGSFTFCPDDPAETARFLQWIMPLCPADKDQPTGIVSVPQRGMTDTPFPSISLMNAASHAEVEARSGKPLAIERWRGNFILDGLPAWEEFNWIGKQLRLGEAEIEVAERVVRCNVTRMNPLTGLQDTDTLATLNNAFGHQDFGVYARVVKGGKVTAGDKVEVI